MSEKRQQHQQRRQRRKTQDSNRSRRTELDRLLAEMARLAAGDAPEIEDALEAEQWASHLIGLWHRQPVPGEDVDALFLPGFVKALERLGSTSALAVLRALTAVAPPVHAVHAREAAERLATAGHAEPAWELTPMPATGAVLVYEPVFDDGMSVLVEYGSHTLGVYIDHNLGGIVKDAFLAGPPADVRADLSSPDISQRKLDLGEARALIEAALDELDHTLDPPVDDEVYELRALIEARVRELPDRFVLPEEDVSEEQEALLADFLASEGERWRGDEDAEDAVTLAISFGANYNHGGPLRWSPVVVELFMLDWLPRKVARDPELFERVPAVLRDWVRFAGRRRNVPKHLLREAVAAVDLHRDEMLETVDDPAAWGPAKLIAAAALDAGVDLSNRAEVDAFIRRYAA